MSALPIDVTVKAKEPILGDYSQLPPPIIIYSLASDASQAVQLVVGYTYEAIANTTVTVDFEILVNPLYFEVE